MNQKITDRSSSFPLRMELLGPPQLLWQGTPQTTLLVKAQALLFFLALDPQPHTRTALATLLWSDMPDEKARANLRTALSRLRNSFGDYLITTRQTVSFDGEVPHWLDVPQFEKGLADPASLRQREAVGLYRGEFLATFHVRGAPVFEEWALVQRERLRYLALEGMAALAKQADKQGDLGQAMADWRRLLALDPWRESAHRGLMRLLARTGDRAAALAQFEECRRLLKMELDVSPAPATMALFGQIKDDAVTWWQGDKAAEVHPVDISASHSGVRPLPHNLPAATTSFHGRSRELARIQETLQEPGCRLFTLMGLGGIGKSRLALEAARQLAAAGDSLFTDGIYWVPLAAVTGQSGIVAAIATAVGFAFSGRAEPEAQLSAYLSNKRLLLLLDNWEQLVADAPYLTDLLQAVPGLKLLVTSRERLDLHEEWLLALDGLSFPDSGDVDLATFDAVQLFTQRARQVNLNFDLAAELAGVLSLCRLVEGMPLGLELAASWVQTFSCANIAAALAESHDDLATAARNVPERHRSLQMAFEYSWRLLTEDEQAVLLGLAVFRGGFTWAAAETVAAATRRLLANLVGKSLVQRGRNGRYDMHEQLRQFTLQKNDTTNRNQTRLNHAAHFAAFLQQRETAIKTKGQQDVIAAIKADIENIRMAWETAVAEQNRHLLAKMAATIFHFYMKQGLQREGARVFGEVAAMLAEDGRVAANEQQQTLLSRLLIFQGRCGEFISQNFDEPRQMLKQGLRIARRHGQKEDIALALMGLGQLSIVSGDSQQADIYLQESLTICQSASLPWIKASVLNLLAFVLNNQGFSTEAKAMCAEAVAVQRQLGNVSGIASALTTMGIVHNSMGDYAASKDAYAEVLQHCRQNGLLIGSAQALTGLFVASYRLGNYEEAAVYAQESLAVNQDAGDNLGIAIAHHNLGFLTASENKHQRAITQFHQALDIYQTTGENLLRSSNTRRHMADSLITLGELELAREQLRLALETVPKQGWPSRGAEMLLSSAKLLIKLDARPAAGEILTFLRDDEVILPAVKEQAAEILTSGAFEVPPRYQTMDAVMAAAQRYLCDS